jgi:osmotically-inducible protein OsmY
MASVKTLIGVLLISTVLLQGCAALLVGAGVGAASAAHDRRTLGTQVDDSTLSGRVSKALSNDIALKERSKINVEVFNGVTLLVGQAPSNELKRQAELAVSAVKNIGKIHNQIRVREPIPGSAVSHDVWLNTKVSASLVSDKRIDGLHISVTVEDSEVFLMGLVTSQEADIAVEVARNVEGVVQVVKAFEYL